MTEALVNIITSALSVALSVALETVPQFKAWWNVFPHKRLAWLGGCFVAPFVVVGLAYLGAPVGIANPGPFIWDGLSLALQAGFLAYFAGQAVFAGQKEAAGFRALRD